jgi:hypothetical protein
MTRRQGDISDTFQIADVLLDDDLIREARKNDRKRPLGFLDEYAATMPHTIARYAVEHLDKEQRAHCLKKTARTGHNQGDRS